MSRRKTAKEADDKGEALLHTETVDAHDSMPFRDQIQDHPAKPASGVGTTMSSPDIPGSLLGSSKRRPVPRGALTMALRQNRSKGLACPGKIIPGGAKQKQNTAVAHDGVAESRYDESDGIDDRRSHSGTEKA